MTDIPIIFSGPMVRALLDGGKTMTRRLAHLKPQIFMQVGDGPLEPLLVDSPWQKVRPGDRLWVREAAAYIDNSAFGQASYWQYRADTNGREFPGDWPAEEKNNPDRPRWKPSIHMPRQISRLTLIVTDIKIERIKEIDGRDAIAEGVLAWRAGWSVKEAALAFLRGTQAAAETNDGTVAQRLFYLLWTSLHGERAWSENPFVVAVAFRVIRANIDTPAARIAA